MPPVAAIVTGFFLVAIPVIMLVGVWAAVTMWRVVFPEDELPFDRGVDIARAQANGETVPVRLADILDQQRRQPMSPVMPHRLHVKSEGEGGEDPLAADLWLRRN